MTLLTVAMPVYGKPVWMVREAVESVLADDVDLQLVLVNDNCPVFDGLPDVTDPRVVRYRLPENRGAFYAASLALAAAQTPFWHLHDSDDLTEPGRFAAMLDAIGDASAVATPTVTHNLDGTVKVNQVKARKPGHGSARWIIHSPAHIYRTEALRTVGIPADNKIGTDAAYVALFWHRYPVKVIDGPRYLIRKTEGSLTLSPVTGFGTEQRRRSRLDANQLFYEAAKRGGPLRGEKPDPVHVEELRALL